MRIGLTILVSTLGYFVDIYDLMLFTIYRQPSVKDLGGPELAQLDVGISLFNFQLVGEPRRGFVSQESPRGMRKSFGQSAKKFANFS